MLSDWVAQEEKPVELFTACGVVLEARPILLFNVDEAMYAARLLEVGLTAYSKTSGAALLKLRRMYQSWIEANDHVGNLDLLVRRVAGLHRI